MTNRVELQWQGRGPERKSLAGIARIIRANKHSEARARNAVTPPERRRAFREMPLPEWDGETMARPVTME